MTIYEVTFASEGARDGYQRAYFTSQTARRKWIAELKRQHAQETAAADRRREAGEYPPHGHPTYRVDHIQTSTLELTGTCREMVLWALRYNTD